MWAYEVLCNVPYVTLSFSIQLDWISCLAVIHHLDGYPVVQTDILFFFFLVKLPLIYTWYVSLTLRLRRCITMRFQLEFSISVPFIFMADGWCGFTNYDACVWVCSTLILLRIVVIDLNS